MDLGREHSDKMTVNSEDSGKMDVNSEDSGNMDLRREESDKMDVNSEDSGLKRVDSGLRFEVTPVDDDPLYNRKQENEDGEESSFDFTRRRFTKAANELILEIPATQLNKLMEREELGSYFREIQHFCGIGTLHGALRAYQGKPLSRVFWGILMCSSLVFLFVQIGNVMSRYSSKPTMTKIHQTQNLTLPTPLVTFCNYSPIDPKRIKALNATGALSPWIVDFLTKYSYDLRSFYLEENREHLLKMHNARKHTEQFAHFSMEDFAEAISYNCSDYLRSCQFAGFAFDCCEYATELFTIYGQCYTIDLTDTVFGDRQKYPGEYNGLQLIMDSKFERTSEDDDEAISKNLVDAGFRFYYHLERLASFASTEGISVSPGSVLRSSLEMDKYSLLHRHSWGDCDDSYPYDDVPELKSLPYTYANCLTVCRAVFFKKLCGCAPQPYNSQLGYPTCTPYHAYMCLEKTIRNTSAEFIELQLPLCSDCSPACQSHKLRSYNSYSHSLSRRAVDMMSDSFGETPEYIRKNYAVVSVFYRELEVRVYTQLTATSVTDVLSSIGGTMGLTLGISIFTILELTIFIVKMIWIAVSSRRRGHLRKKKEDEDEHERRVQETVESYGEFKEERERERREKEHHGNLHRLRNLGAQLKRNLGKRKRTQSVDSDVKHRHIGNILQFNLNLGREVSECADKDYKGITVQGVHARRKKSSIHSPHPTVDDAIDSIDIPIRFHTVRVNDRSPVKRKDARCLETVVEK